MDFLKGQFHLDLSTEGNTYVLDGHVFIRDKHWPPEDILNLASDEAYQEVFQEWLDERKTTMLQIADEILERFDNADRFESLKKAYAGGAVVPFIGAGMSFSSGYPGWKEYLRSLCDESSLDKTHLDTMLKNGEYEEAAQTLFDMMGAPSFNEYLNNKFANSKTPIGPVNYLPKIFPGSVITTNFDPLLEGLYSQSIGPFDEVILGVSGDQLPRLMGMNHRTILKLHGRGDKPKERILTLDEYNRAYSEGATLRDLVAYAFFSKTLLFLGCSLSVDRTIRLMCDYVSEYGHDNLVRHYAFLKLNDESERLERKRQLTEANIFPIWYEGDDHDEAIEALLLKLSEGIVEL